MLRLDMVDEKPVISQTVTSPNVYLDLWALIDIALNNFLSEQFRKAILTKNGTLLFSCMHLFEFCDMTDKTQLKTIGLFLDSLVGHLAFIDVIPKKIIEDENQLSSEGKNIYFPIHKSFVQFFASLKSRSLNPLISFGDLLNMLDHGDLKLMKNNFHLEFNSKINEWRLKRKNNKLSIKIRGISGDINHNFATRYIEQELLDWFVSENNNITPNSWRDFYHTVVPLAYCDYVLLDKQFAHISQRISQKLKEKRNFKIANVYNKVEMFLYDF